MKKLIIFLFLMLLSASAYAVTKEDITLKVGESIVVGGRNFTLVSIGSNDQMLMTIDGEKHILSTIEEEYFDGIYIYPEFVYGIESSLGKALDLNISMNYTCGNGQCEAPWEDSDNCCIDCNCSANYTCYNKKCFKSELIQCYKDSDCKDNDSCTRDYCDSFPLICRHDEITECEHGDGCCPLDCTDADDEDCYVEKPTCETDADCDDNNSSTIDKCSKITNWCYYEADETEEETVEEEITGDIIAEEPIIEKKGLFSRIWGFFKGIFT
jgi:hypothetical protein